MFFIIILILSVLLISLNYQNSKQLNTKIAKERIEQNAQKVKLAYRELTSSIHLLLDALADSKLKHNPKAMIDESLLRSVGAVLQNAPVMNSLYIGYKNNESVLIRTILPEYMLKNDNVPNNAKLQVEIYTHSKGLLTRYYFDDNFNFISATEHDQKYSPTERPWYKNAKSSEKIYLTPPYKYKFMDKLGVTYSKIMNNKNGVIAIDVTLSALNEFIESLDLFSFYKNSKLIIFDEFNNIISHKGTISQQNQLLKKSELTAILKNTVLKLIYENKEITDQYKIKHTQDHWWVKSTVISNKNEQTLKLMIAIPEKELLSDAFIAVNNQIAYTLLLLAFGTILIFIISEKIVSPIKQLTYLADTFSNLNFKGIKIPRSNIIELNDLANSFTLVANTIDRFLTTLTLVSSNNNLHALLQSIVDQCKDQANANFALLWIRDEKEKKQIKLAAYNPQNAYELGIQYEKLIIDLPELENKMRKNQPFLFSPCAYNFAHCQLPKEIKRVWAIPMINRHNAYVGCILLGFHYPLSQKKEGKIHFLHAFLGFISLIHENWEHIFSQKQLFLSLIEMMASAIDTKSPYTGAHCQRVPELSSMLAEAAHLDKEYYPEFTLDEKSREALHLAAWLHDCGKVTTPEYVIDKATKLETLFNRIHEIRTRFEVVKRDIQIQYWQKYLENKKNKEELDIWLDKELKLLDEEFAFIAKLNHGENNTTQEDIKKLHKIASRTWYRTLDDSLGISWEEKNRLKKQNNSTLPYKEYLLKDALEQKIAWSAVQQKQFKNWSYIMQPPALQFNRGEIYNLSIAKGTLTEEERFIIKDHIVQTINMLNKLPYPEHLARIPEIAGGHHERVDGQGYPKGLDESNFSIDARIIAVADIFEALTARDRPYKSIKTVNESLIILAKMAKERHIDEGLFRIFVEQKVYLQYAKRFLSKEQNDAVDIKVLLALLN